MRRRVSNALGQADMTFTYGAAGAGWTPLAGNWNIPPKALLAAGGPVTPSANTPALTQADLQPIIQEAIARWASTGVDAATLAKLTQAQFAIADLPGAYLGKTQGSQITIDSQCGRLWLVRRSHAGGG